MKNASFFLLNVFRVKGYSTKSIMVPEPGDVDYKAAKKYSLDGLDKQIEILSIHNKNTKVQTY